ncbi:MAG TPA: hypothetical protein VN493_09540 [Thermoanaerobaculia bacterium]|nr:hypothetical protein [Thermoanaerobaculia bacterium]
MHLKNSLALFLCIFLSIAFCASKGATAQSTGDRIFQELVRAQVENQQAQAAYYRQQTSPSKDVWWKSSLTGTMLGAAIALAGVLFTGWLQANLEKRKWKRSKADELEKETRLATAELTRGIAAGIHAVAWCSWKARYEPDDLKEKDFALYDREIKGIFPEIVGSRVVLAALDRTLHEQMTPFVKELYQLDKELAKASALFRKSREEGIRAVDVCYSHANLFDKKLLSEVSKIVNMSDTQSQSRESAIEDCEPSGRENSGSAPNPSPAADGIAAPEG